MDPIIPPTADARVRAAVAAGDRRRRAQAANRRLWRAAPIWAVVCLCVAVASRLTGWPAALPLAFLGAALAALLAYIFVGRRERVISDAVAASIDADAGLGGELRSASWFAATDTRDAWADHHVQRAADRLRTVDWVRIYPPVRAPREQITTSLLVFATLAIAIAFPARAGVDWNFRLKAEATLPAHEAERGDRVELEALSPELRKQLEELLAAAETGTLALDGKTVTAADMRGLLARLSGLRDREALKELARAMDPGSSVTTAQELKALADRARHAAEMSAESRELRDALGDLARNLSDAAIAEQRDGRPSRGEPSDRARSGEAVPDSDAPGMDEATIQSVKEAQTAGGGSSVMMMMSNQEGPAGAAPGFGTGGMGGSTSAEASGAALEEALRKETIEASADNAGDNVDAEVRRETEQGQATVTLSHGHAGRSDQSRASAPPAVPEARRSNVQRYFIRKQ